MTMADERRISLKLERTPELWRLEMATNFQMPSLAKVSTYEFQNQDEVLEAVERCLLYCESLKKKGMLAEICINTLCAEILRKGLRDGLRTRELST